MGNYRRQWLEDSDSEERPRRRFSVEEDLAFERGKKYERRQLDERRRRLRIVLWCIAGLVIAVGVINFLQDCVIFIRMR
jgi:hypothetical protein